MALVPVALCGRHPATVSTMIDLMLPDYQVIHVCNNPEAAKSELPALLRGDPVTASSGQGTNYDSASPTSGTAVRAIYVGGAFTPTDVTEIKAACDAVRSVPFFVADRSKSPAGATVPPPAEVLSARLRQKMLEVRKAGGQEGDWEGGVHMF